MGSDPEGLLVRIANTNVKRKLFYTRARKNQCFVTYSFLKPRHGGLAGEWYV